MGSESPAKAYEEQGTNNMKLSTALLEGHVKFAIERDIHGKPTRYKTFQGAVQDYMPGADADNIPFPIAFSFPQFGVEMDGGLGHKIIEALPEIGRPPADAKIWFLCDVIDVLSIRHLWSETQVGELIAKIEVICDEFGATEENGFHPTVLSPERIAARERSNTPEGRELRNAILETLVDNGGSMNSGELLEKLGVKKEDPKKPA